MPDTDWRAWVHLTASTLGHWLPGDERGFRSRRHRLHSSGDYQNPPPLAEHAGLRRDAEARSKGAVRLDPAQRQIVVAALQTKLEEMGAQPRAIACDAVHCHALVCCAGDAKVMFGRAKQAASHALREQIPGKVWGRSSHPTRIRDEWHYQRVVAYIKAHAEQGAAVWVPARPDTPRGLG